MKNTGDRSVLIMLAKAPVAGKAKTRLAAKYGANGAAILYRQMMLYLLQQLSSLGHVCVHLYCSPDIRHPFFLQCRRRFGVILKRQQGNDLGERMYRALRNTAGNHQHGVLIGSDVPELNLKILTRLLREKPAKKTVSMIPADDGGYVLISLRGNHRGVFRNIPWGTDQVMRKSRIRIRQGGLRLNEYGICQDVDAPADIRRLKRKGIVKGYP